MFTFPRNCSCLQTILAPLFILSLFIPVHSPSGIYSAVWSSTCWKCHISSCQNWLFADLAADFPKIPFPCWIKNAAAERLLVVCVNLTVTRDMTFSDFFSLVNGSVWLLVPGLTLPPRFSLFIFHTMYPLILSSLVDPGLFNFCWHPSGHLWASKDRTGMMFPPTSSSVHSKYLLKEHPSSKYSWVREVDTKAADG